MTTDSTQPSNTSTPQNGEYDAAMGWLDDLDPASTPAAVVPQEVRDVAAGVVMFVV